MYIQFLLEDKSGLEIKTELPQRGEFRRVRQVMVSVYTSSWLAEKVR